jgi:hypothetical protein
MSNKKPEMGNKKPELSKKEQKVWQFLANNLEASIYETSLACEVDVLFVENVASRMAAWAGVDNGAGEWNAGPADILTSYPDDNPKTQYGEKKLKMSSTPIMPLQEMGKVFELGAKKYGRYNWRLHAVSATVYYDAALRHLMAWFEGEDTDPESGVSHLAHVMACMAILMDAQKNGKLKDNRLDAEDTL